MFTDYTKEKIKMYERGAKPKSEWLKSEIKERYEYGPYSNEDLKKIFKYNIKVIREILLKEYGTLQKYPNVIQFYIVNEDPFQAFSTEELLDILEAKKNEMENIEKDRKEREEVIIPVIFEYHDYDYYGNKYDKHESLGWLKGDWIYFSPTCNPKGRKRNINSKGVYWRYRYEDKD